MDTPSFRWTRGSVIALIVLCLAALLDIIDSTVVNVAMPAIKDDLHFSEGGLAWVVNAYMVPFGGLLLVGGRVGDLLGRRRTLLAGTVLFTAASLMSGLAQQSGALIAARAVQGAAAAFVVPMTMAMLAAVFPAGAPRNRAFAVWGGSSAAGGTLGLILGGLLVTAVGWRWIFLVNIPVGVFVFVAALRHLPADRPPAREHRRFDAVGALTVTAGASLLAYAVVQTEDHGWASARTIALLVVATALIGYFLIHEGLVARSPLVPLAMWRNRSVTGANLVTVLQGSSLFAMFYSTTLFMQQVLHYSAMRTGLAYVPLGVSILVSAGLGPVLVPRLGVRYVAVVGSTITAAGLLLLTRISPTTGLPTIILSTVVVGIGGGVIFFSTSVASLAGVENERHGVASALLNVSRQLGGALGLAAIATVVTGRTASALTAGAGPSAALTEGFRRGFEVSAGLMAATILVAIFLLRDDGRGEAVDLAELQQAGAAV
jgi:EmrB/QacA subfamily drug resistance transporter